jgi:hypothetical protein
MKNSLIFLFLLSCLISCDKEDPLASKGQVFALKDGKDWSSSEIFFGIQELENTKYPYGFQLNASFVDNNGVVREALSLQTFLPIMERQEIMEKWSLSNFQNNNLLIPNIITILDEGDVSGSRYGIDPSVNSNFIQITEIDSTNSMIYGIFDLSMVIVRRSSSQPDIPESIHLKNGRFNAKLPLGWNNGVF